eukprot:Seg3752.1 transcript_id=Seg3752.1/GoldUCD/mRNA.D3Y31 product="Glucosamine 6-phosphate N-acetyltransferase" protein_id=Seg3752.1/GoldUCD/D3Y31
MATMTNGLHNVDLFDESILKNIDFSDNPLKIEHGLSPTNAGENLILRPLNSDDYDKGYIELLRQLTEVGDVTKEKYLERFIEMKSCKESYYIVVIEDTSTKKIIGNGTLAVEFKFIHTTAKRGRVEDIVVDKEYRKRHLGQLLVETLTKLSESVGCYKTSLDCKEQLIPFYGQFGFKREDGRNYLCKRFFN